MELFTPEIGLVFWMFVAFILLFLVLAKWCWPMIIKMMDKRASTIDRGVEDARQAREQLDNAREEARKYVVEAQAKQSEMLREAAKMKSDIIEEARREAADGLLPGQRRGGGGRPQGDGVGKTRHRPGPQGG